MSEIVTPPFYYEAESRQVRKDIGDLAYPVAQVCNWSEDTHPTGHFIVRACNSHDQLVAALRQIAGITRPQMCMDGSAKVGSPNATGYDFQMIARHALAAVGAA